MATWPASLGNPQFSGYDLETTDPTVRTDMEGGSARVRRRYTAAPDAVSLKFLFDAAQMATFRTFWDYDMANGSAWVYMPVKTGYVAGLESRECRPINGRFKSVPVSAAHWLVEFQVEVRRGVYVWYDTINAMKLPSLDLDFAGTQSLNSVLTSSAQPVASVEFSRASVATYIGSDGLIKTAEVNEARFDHDPVTGECKGLLIEESRTNLLTYSEQFDNAAWGKVGATISPNTTTAPDGTVTADKLIEDTTTGSHKVTQQVTFGTGWVSFSVRAKAAERSKLMLYLTDLVSAICYVNFDLLTCEVIGSTFQTPWAGGFASIRNLGDGWCECVLAAPATQGATKRAEIRATDASGVDSYTGDGVSGLYIWGAQLEAGAFPTSYIPTTTAQATRAADIAQMTGANFSSWYRQDEGTFVTESDTSAVTATDKRVFSANDGTTSNHISLHYGANSGGVLTSAILNAGIFQFGPNEGAYIANTPYRRAFAYKAGNPKIATKGALNVATAPSAIIPTVNKLDIGNRVNVQQLNGHVARLTYFPKRLSNAELQGLSA